MTSMLMTEIAPPPGAQAVAGLRARTRAARRIALIALTGSLALLSATQLLAERAATTRETPPLTAPTQEAQPFAEPTPEAPPQAARTQKPLPSAPQPSAVLALVVFVGALPVLALTQAAWGVRVRQTRRREHELYVAPPASRLRPLSRLGMACGWALVVLLGGALPRLFADAGRHAVATVLADAVNVLAMVATAAGMCFCLCWARDALRRARDDPWWTRNARGRARGTTPWSARDALQPARDPRGIPARAGRAGGVPGDPWDPGRGAPRRRRGAVLWAGAAGAVAALLGARAHFWTPATPMIYALLVTTFACMVVTDE
ncbi:hypothetical protein ACTMTF_15695 [Nonomuraea sp. ZG12]|uniref:hypothetical protein n=1 Tax=Nonomuraea sp. ZG12 TaxID=3452207 RepID=UPI003F88A1A1